METNLIWGHMFQEGEEHLQCTCEGFDSLCLHQFEGSRPRHGQPRLKRESENSGLLLVR